MSSKTSIEASDLFFNFNIGIYIWRKRSTRCFPLNIKLIEVFLNYEFGTWCSSSKSVTINYKFSSIIKREI